EALAPSWIAFGRFLDPILDLSLRFLTLSISSLYRLTILSARLLLLPIAFATVLSPIAVSYIIYLCSIVLYNTHHV
ncbi:hypothetical protein SERLA73DRAFT_81642, partial [Serpula lacrymans var. lacrymans S7.3]